MGMTTRVNDSMMAVISFPSLEVSSLEFGVSSPEFGVSSPAPVVSSAFEESDVSQLAFHLLHHPSNGHCV